MSIWDMASADMAKVVFILFLYRVNCFWSFCSLVCLSSRNVISYYRSLAFGMRKLSVISFQNRKWWCVPHYLFRYKTLENIGKKKSGIDQVRILHLRTLICMVVVALANQDAHKCPTFKKTLENGLQIITGVNKLKLNIVGTSGIQLWIW